VRLCARDGRRIAVLIHVEVQGDPESDFGERMFVYQARLRDRYGLDVVSRVGYASRALIITPSKTQHSAAR
jgi:hypothetical protein